jgi:hypothetical protein
MLRRSRFESMMSSWQKPYHQLPIAAWMPLAGYAHICEALDWA